MRLGVKIDKEDKEIILLCSLPSSYDHLVIPLTYKKDTINFDAIIGILLLHSQRRQCIGRNSRRRPICDGVQDRGRNKGKVYYGNKEV